MALQPTAAPGRLRTGRALTRKFLILALSVVAAGCRVSVPLVLPSISIAPTSFRADTEISPNTEVVTTAAFSPTTSALAVML